MSHNFIIPFMTIRAIPLVCELNNLFLTYNYIDLFEINQLPGYLLRNNYRAAIRKLSRLFLKQKVYYLVHKIPSYLFYDNHNEVMLLLRYKAYRRSN
jgi:hypothetical protein